MTQPEISVQDTAAWVAMYRALESERPDALFRDPFARTLAGERGASILAAMPKAKTYGWPMIVRTAIMDEIILRIVPSVGTVLNLAAGLDARPYRLPLPASLRWIEVDFPSTLEYKANLLAAQIPACVLERVALDLADRYARRNLFARVGAESSAVLVISEGLLVYLEPDEVAALADDLAGQRSFRFWMVDVAAPFILRIMQRAWGKRIGSGAAFKFAPADAAAVFEPHGWRIAEYRSNMIEGARLHRFPMAWLYRILFAKMWREEVTRRNGPMTGVLLLENAKSNL